MLVVALLVALAAAVALDAATGRYGEASLALACGVLTAYVVPWTAPRLLGAVAVWSAFALCTRLIARRNAAALAARLYREAAIAYAPDAARTEEAEARLRGIAGAAAPGLGPVERAEAVRLFAFRKVPAEVMPSALRFAAVLSVTARLPTAATASFAADVYRVFAASRPGYHDLVVDTVSTVIRESAADPADFIAAFRHARPLALARSVDALTFFAALQAGLEAGVPPEAMADYVAGRTAPGAAAAARAAVDGANTP